MMLFHLVQLLLQNKCPSPGLVPEFYIGAFLIGDFIAYATKHSATALPVLLTLKVPYALQKICVLMGLSRPEIQ